MIKYIKKKKENGMEMLIDSYGALITFIVRRNLNNLKEYEEECIDDVLFSIWNNIDSYDQKKNSFKNWIGAIAKYKTIDYKRKYIKIMEIEDISIHVIEDSRKVEENILKEELRGEIEELLKNLKEQDRELFIKYYLEEKDMDEICRHMEMNSAVAYNRLSRGREKLRKFVNSFKIV